MLALLLSCSLTLSFSFTLSLCVCVCIYIYAMMPSNEKELVVFAVFLGNLVWHTETCNIFIFASLHSWSAKQSSMWGILMMPNLYLFVFLYICLWACERSWTNEWNACVYVFFGTLFLLFFSACLFHVILRENGILDDSQWIRNFNICG